MQTGQCHECLWVHEFCMLVATVFVRSKTFFLPDHLNKINFEITTHPPTQNHDLIDFQAEPPGSRCQSEAHPGGGFTY